jgi:hypothetical protein
MLIKDDGHEWAYYHTMEFHFTPLTAVCQWLFLFIPGKFSENLPFSAHSIISPLLNKIQEGNFCAPCAV